MKTQNIIGEPFDPRFDACGFFPDDVICRQPRAVLTDGQKLIYIVLVRLYRMYDGKCFPSHEFLAYETGKSVRQVRYDLRRLQAMKLVSRRRRRRQSTTYAILFHELFLERQSIADQDQGEPLKNGNPLPIKDGKNGNVELLERQSSVVKNGNPLPTNTYMNPIIKNPSSSSSRDAASVQQEEEPTPRQDKTENPEDLIAIAAFMSDVLRAKAGLGEPPKVTNVDAIAVRMAAPDWSAREIIEGFRQYAPGGKPKTVRWFPKTAADVYQRLQGKPPEIPVPAEVDPEPRRIAPRDETTKAVPQFPTVPIDPERERETATWGEQLIAYQTVWPKVEKASGRALRGRLDIEFHGATDVERRAEILEALAVDVSQESVTRLLGSTGEPKLRLMKSAKSAKQNAERVHRALKAC